MSSINILLSSIRKIKLLVIGIVIGLGLSLGLVIFADVNFPHVFVSGETLTADKLNKNFEAINNCSPDTVRSGTGCMDKFEASMWFVTETQLVTKIIDGSVTKADLLASAAVQIGVTDFDHINRCASNASDCNDVYAVSIPDVLPAVNITWFQALASCRNSHKRLPTNAEWQAAALGTPNPINQGVEDCVTGPNGTRQNTKVRANCESSVHAFDMAGNLTEWTSDWMQGSISPYDAPLREATAEYGSDQVGGFNLTGLPSKAGNNFPAAIIRGGSFGEVISIVGAYSASARPAPDGTFYNVGFRCVK